jgi:hypothetical protein
MDEYYGYLRIATTRGRVPDPKVESAVSILREDSAGNLVRVGAVEHIAPGEDIRSVRFDEDRGYVVTFKKTDPLFVLDLYDASAPRILGELKIPGFSSYIHRIDANHLLSIGFDGEETGSVAYFDGLLLQLFDVTNPTDPKLLHREEIGTRGSSSQAATDHLAFNYSPENGILAIPATVCEGGGDGRYGDELAFSGLLLYRVSTVEGFGRLGGIDHGKAGVHCRNWWTRATSLVKRSVFLDDLVVSIADARLKAQRLGSLGTDVADVVVLDVRLEVLGQVLDALGEQRDLNLGRAGVPFTGAKLLDELGLVLSAEGHRMLAAGQDEAGQMDGGVCRAPPRASSEGSEASGHRLNAHAGAQLRARRTLAPTPLPARRVPTPERAPAARRRTARPGW